MSETINRGDFLFAKHPCIVDGEQTLTLGKQYKVVAVDFDDLFIIDDEGDRHYFSLKIKNTSYYGKFFFTKLSEVRLLKLNSISKKESI